MSTTPRHDPAQRGVSSGSMQTLASRPPAPAPDPSASKRVRFYRSGDPQFGGHRMVINSRTFKTFDGLLDALSKKVPLPFGVRTITTPRGRRTLRALEELQDGASYVCSDQRRVKPLDLAQANRPQVPWNTTRPVTAGRRGRREVVRQLAKRNEEGGRMAERAVAVRTPKRLAVFKNRDPNVKRIVVLQRRTAPTFEALLDYLSQVLQFPVLKLYTADGRRVDGLPALILCDGVIVAAGNEPFRLGNFNLQAPSQPTQAAVSEAMGQTWTRPQIQTKKSQGSSTRSRNFSLSSERYFVNQINKSLNQLYGQNVQGMSSVGAKNHQPLESDDMDNCECMENVTERPSPIMPAEDDIEKSFRVNQDGSMTVEMRVHLRVKQEEMIHWSTTLKRTCIEGHRRTVCSSQPGSEPDPEDTNCSFTKDSKRLDGCESKDMNCCSPAEKRVAFSNERGGNCRSGSGSENLEKPASALKRSPTPGPRHVKRKETVVENIKRVSETEVQESTVGSYSYMEHTVEGELTEGYCVVSQSSSSSSRPVPKPRKNGSPGTRNTQSHTSPGVAEVLQLQDNAVGARETMLHVCETQGSYDNYLSNSQCHVGMVPSDSLPQSQACSTDAGPQSSSHGSDVDLTRASTSSDSQNERRDEVLSLSSGDAPPTQKTTNNLSLLTDGKMHMVAESQSDSSQREVADLQHLTKKGVKNESSKSKMQRVATSVKSKSTGAISSDAGKKLKGNGVESSRALKNITFPDRLSRSGSERKTISSGETDTHGQRAKTALKSKQNTPAKSQSLILNIGNTKRLPSGKDFNLNNMITTNTSHNINNDEIDALRPPLKKNVLDILTSNAGQLKRRLTKQRSVNGGRTRSQNPKQELTESISLPVFCSPPTNVHQYVENWLEKIQPGSAPYVEETLHTETDHKPRAVFHLGGESFEDSEQNFKSERALNESASFGNNEKSPSHPSVVINGEEEPGDERTQTVRSFCKSMPSVRIHPAEQESRVRMHKSTEALVPDQRGSSESTKVGKRSGMKPALEQLCLSIQSIRGASGETHGSSIEKSSSLPDFSTQVASAFGSPSKAVLSFLSVMTLRESIFGHGSDGVLRTNAVSCPEALQVMQSLEKLANMEDEDELRASLTSLQSSTSSKLQQSWRDFQERNVIGSPPVSPRNSEQEFALMVETDGEDQDKESSYSVEKLMEELNMSEDLRREISTLMEGDIKNSGAIVQSAKGCSGKLKAPSVTPMDIHDTTTDKTSDEETGFSEERISQDEDTAETDRADIESNVRQSPDPQQTTDALVKEHSYGNFGSFAENSANHEKEKANQEGDGLQSFEDAEPVPHHTASPELDTGDLERVDAEEENLGTEAESEVTIEPGCTEEQTHHSENEDELEEENDNTEQPNIIPDVSENESVLCHHPLPDMEIEEQEQGSTGLSEHDTDQDIQRSDTAAPAKEGDCYETDREDISDEERVDEVDEKCLVSESESKYSEHHHSNSGDEDSRSASLKSPRQQTGNEEHTSRSVSTDYSHHSCTEKQETVVEGEVEESDCEESVPCKSQDSEDEDDGQVDNCVNKQSHSEEEQKHYKDSSQDKDSESEESQFKGEKTVSSHSSMSESEVKPVRSELHESLKSQLEKDLKRVEETGKGSQVADVLSKSSESIDKYDGQHQRPASDSDRKDSVHSAASDSDCKDSVQSAASDVDMNTMESEQAEEEDERGVEEHRHRYPVEVSQELLDLVNSALLCSSLTLRYDSNGNFRIEPRWCQSQTLAGRSKPSNTYGQKRLPSPNTSDLSDYRPETSGSSSNQSQVSMELLTETGDEATEGLPITEGSTKQNSGKLGSADRAKSRESSRNKSTSGEKTKFNENPASMSNSNRMSSRDSLTKSIEESQDNSNNTTLFTGNSEAVQRIAFHPGVDLNEGVLIDKGRWLLKENHLIRNSPPERTGMYGDVDTTSADTGQENTSEDAPCSKVITKQSPMAVLSSSELEDMAKPPTPNCTYFNMSHGSDSDPFQDDQSTNGNRAGQAIKGTRALRVSPLGQGDKMRARKNGSLSSFASVEFKLPDVKVHPDDGPVVAPPGVEKHNRPQSTESRSLQEEDSGERLDLRCGQHCPIL